MDHFSKFHVLFPLKSKTAREVAQLLEERVQLALLAYSTLTTGVSLLTLLHALLKQWNCDVIFVNGRPRHSQSQGLVERGNRTVEYKIAAMKSAFGFTEPTGHPSASWLPSIMYGLNSEISLTTKESPYHLVFGRLPPAPVFPGLSMNVVDKEDINNPEPEDTQDPAEMPARACPVNLSCEVFSH